MEMKIYLGDTRALQDPVVFEKLYGRLWQCRREKVDRMRLPQGKRLALGAGILLQEALADAGIPGPEPHFAENEYGKPFLPDHPEVHFNLSHSGEMVMCVTGGRELGCDIQEMHKADLQLAKRFYHESETDLFKEVPEGEERDLLFTRLWCLKESYIKALGRGLSIELNSFAVRSVAGERPEVIVEAPCSREKHFLLLYDDVPGYCCSVCTGGTLPEKVRVSRTADWKSPLLR